MKLDTTTKLLLLIIALGLWLVALTPLFHPTTASASGNTHCTGTVKVNPWGSAAPSIGGWDVDLKCSE
jgi:hypothetical protein